MRKNFTSKKAKQDLDTIKKEVNPQSKEQKEIKNLHAIIVERLVTHQTNAGAMERKNLMESVQLQQTWSQS